MTDEIDPACVLELGQRWRNSLAGFPPDRPSAIEISCSS